MTNARMQEIISNEWTAKPSETRSAERRETKMGVRADEENMNDESDF